MDLSQSPGLYFIHMVFSPGWFSLLFVQAMVEAVMLRKDTRTPFYGYTMAEYRLGNVSQSMMTPKFVRLPINLKERQYVSSLSNI